MNQKTKPILNRRVEISVTNKLFTVCNSIQHSNSNGHVTFSALKCCIQDTAGNGL